MEEKSSLVYKLSRELSILLKEAASHNYTKEGKHGISRFLELPRGETSRVSLAGLEVLETSTSPISVQKSTLSAWRLGLMFWVLQAVPLGRSIPGRNGVRSQPPRLERPPSTPLRPAPICLRGQATPTSPILATRFQRKFHFFHSPSPRKGETKPPTPVPRPGGFLLLSLHGLAMEVPS